MSPIFDPLNLILLAIAAVVLWRLKSVLGTRTGEERPSADISVFKPKSERKPVPTIDAPATPLGSPEPAKPVWQGFAEDNSEVAKGLGAIAKASPGFAVGEFIEGAKRAYEIILVAYAKGDKQALKPLLGSEVADTFYSVIDQRNRDHNTMVFQFVGVNKTHIERAGMAGRIASLTLRFRSDMILALRSKDGQVLEGDDQAVREVEDIWTFERDSGSRDPNWRLVSTDDEIG